MLPGCNVNTAMIAAISNKRNGNELDMTVKHAPGVDGQRAVVRAWRGAWFGDESVSSSESESSNNPLRCSTSIIAGLLIPVLLLFSSMT